MKSDGCSNISSRISGGQLGLGWISGITLWKSPVAVPMTPHRHSNIELIFCLKGELQYEIDGFGKVSVREGTGVAIPARTTHVLQGGADTPCIRLGLHVGSTMAAAPRRYGVFSSNDFSGFYAALKHMTARTFRLNTKTLDIVRELATLVSIPTLGSVERGIIRTLCSLTLYRVIDILSHPFTATGPNEMNEATKYIKEHFAEKLSIDDLARYMGYGRTQLFALFKQHTGLTPNEFIVRYRIRRAAEMIANGKPESAVAKAVGFSSTTYFRSVYRKYTGKEPITKTRSTE